MLTPAPTVTDAGTVSAALFDDSPTEAPPASAAADNVTVQLVVAADVTELGEHETAETEVVGVDAITVTEPVALPFIVAVTVTV